MKTGYIRASGFNLMTSAERDGRRIVVVMTGGRTAKTRNAHVEALVEAAFKSLDRSPEAKQQIAELRKRHAFEAVITPTNPDDAAVPLLNGKPFNVAMGSAVDGDMSTEEPEASQVPTAPQATRERTILASNESKPKVTRVIKRTYAPAPPPVPSDNAAAESKIVPYTPSSLKSVKTALEAEKEGLSISEYEARQFGTVGGGK